MSVLGIGAVGHGCAPSPPEAAAVRQVDSLNALAQSVRYVYPDSSMQLARKAERMARHYADGRSEALNHQMFVCFLRMDFGTCMKLYQEIQSSTDNQIELLVSEVNMMAICQRAAQNRMFFDYYNRAMERIERIREELGAVEGRNRERLDYALVEFRLTTATNYLNLMQIREAAEELAAIDPEAYLRQDKALLVYFYFLTGQVCLNDLAQGEERVADAFDFFYLAYVYAERTGNTYFFSMVEQALSEMFAQPENYALVRESRKVELGFLYQSVAGDAFCEGDTAEALCLSAALADRALCDADSCSNLLLKVNGARVLGNALFAKGEYDKALDCFETALSYLNLHHQIYYPGDGDRLLATYGEGKRTSVDMEWSKGTEVQTVPGYLMLVRERLSATYSALDDKQKSDYNRNLYLDLLEFTRQDKSLESRIALVAHDNKVLNTLLAAIILLAFAFVLFLFLYARKWKKRNAQQYALLKEMSEWFMKVAFARPEAGWEEALNAYPWMKKEKRILHDILRPYIKWTEKNRVLSGQMDEERMQLREEYLQNERQIAHYKRENVSKRAKVSLVHAIMPFIDRILYAVRRMESRKRHDRAGLAYVGELADEINKYNHVLAEWIRMNRGELELAIESFPLQELFGLLEKGRCNFERKGVGFQVEPTDLWVKADRALTFFMLNTLADNARKFTPPGGQVTVCATGLADAVEIRVTDTGCGLTAEEVDLISSSKVYDARQIGVHSPAAWKEKGSGFGLLNCKGIIEKYKKAGELFSVCRFHVESEAGKGSCFSFRLPKGVKKCSLSALVLWLCLSVSSTVLAASPATDGASPDGPDASGQAFSQALCYADSVYFSNVQGNYDHTMRYADSVFSYLNLYYGPLLPQAGVSCRLTAAGRGMEELEWLSNGVEADYSLIMGVRNELAVAALAMHDWDRYEFNNRQFTHLYKQLTKDQSLEGFYIQQRNTQINLSVSLTLLVFMLCGFSVLVYIVYFRRRILFRFNAMQVLETHHAMLGVMEQHVHPGQTETLVSGLLSVVFGCFKELHETTGIWLLLYREKGEKIGMFRQGEGAYGVLAESLLRQAYEAGNAVYDEVSNTQAYPLVLHLGGDKRICIGSFAVNYGTYRMLKEDAIFESFVVNYLSILLYESVVQRGKDLDNVENAEKEKQRSLFERARIKVQNQILDNCLSTIKHESMYYPSRIKQIIAQTEGMPESQELDAAVQSLKELAEYYKEIYTLLCAQADRQVDVGYFKCEKLSPQAIGEEWKKTTGAWGKRKGYGIALAYEDRLSGDCLMYADATLLRFMLETLTREWMTHLAAQDEGGILALRTSDDGGFVRFTLQVSAPIYTPDEASQLFLPDVGHYPYLLCKEIVREHDKLNNFCGCRINIEENTYPSGCSIWFTIPKYR